MQPLLHAHSVSSGKITRNQREFLILIIASAGARARIRSVFLLATGSPIVSVLAQSSTAYRIMLPIVSMRYLARLRA